MIEWMRKLWHSLLPGEFGAGQEAAAFAPAAPAPQLFNDQQFRVYARRLAAAHPVVAARADDDLTRRLEDYEQALDRAFAAARIAATSGSVVEPAVEWLVDNFYLIKEQIKEVRAGLPKSYLRELPTVVGSGDIRTPRILMLARELVAHSDGRIQLRAAQDFFDAYQAGARLTIGELWAIPLMLRFALIEQMRPVADAISQRLIETVAANEWSERLLDIARERPAQLVLVVAEMAREHVALTPAWIAEFQRRLQGGGPSLALPLLWLDQQLGERHMSLSEALRLETHAQATAQVSIGNCVGSLRLVGRTAWADVVESLSVVEAMLRTDPADVYAKMDFSTRDRFRHVVEQIARRSRLPEWDVAARALASAAAAPDGDGRRRHVGYWLVGNGRVELEQQLGTRNPLRERVTRRILLSPNLYYSGSIVLVTFAVALFGVPAIEHFSQVHKAASFIALLLAGSHVAVALVNWLVTRSLPPQMLCRLALDQGIPDDLRTLVAIPCLLTSENEAAELVAALEIRYLANRDDNLYFALLADFIDAPAAQMPEDAARLAAARTAIDVLNRRHEPDGVPRFCLFVRERRWSPGAQRWMGHERKRGKLLALNRFLRGHTPADLRMLVGDAATLQHARYVIALDADTELPPQCAQRLVATMAHPLNRPHVDRHLHRVTDGYAILQPRVSVDAGRDSTSAFARMHGDDVGLDPYTRLVSDVYQDLFAEASFVGKGIYDIDAFTATTGMRFPDNLILSHDLLEGSYARAALASDVELLERHPENYSTDVRRRHRWTRGDWQIVSWLLPWVPGPRGRRLRNTITVHHRLKLLDNLRRSLVPAALFLLLLDGWLLSARPLYWTVLAIGVIFASPLLISFESFLARNPRMDWRVHLQLNVEALERRLRQAALLLVMLPFEAWFHGDAIVRSLWRLLVTRRHLLQWTEASEMARRAPRSVAAFYRLMWPAAALAAATALFVVQKSGGAIIAAMPLLLLWAFSPLLATLLSRVRRREEPAALDRAQRAFLGMVARRTWRFFDALVGEADHYLPPDNQQEYPIEQTAHRTSPTNIGMYLISAQSAADFGYITPTELLDRVTATLGTLERLKRERGHFLNWYDTTTLEPLPPLYVSSVDSGNLLGCLLVLARGLVALNEERVLPSRVWPGLCDTWRVYAELASSDAQDDVSDADAQAIEVILDSAPASNSSLREQARVLATLCTHAQALAARRESAAAELKYWSAALLRQCKAWQQALAERAPWLDLPALELDESNLPNLLERIDHNPSSRRASVLAAGAMTALGADAAGAQRDLHAAFGAFRERVRAIDERANALAARCRALCEVDYDFLWVPEQRLLSIGFHVEQQSRDTSLYDLLASEARLASFIGIAQGKLPRKHWFALGRLLTMAEGRPALVSWSGSMFEYLMPLLLMPGFENTLLMRSCRAAVARQIAYGSEHAVPWGISESAYNITDAQFVYQYRAFGVPGLGLKRGLSDDLVIAPYASAMALLVNAEDSCTNLQVLEGLGAVGTHGFYEALDYTAARLPAGAKFALVRAYMAHHQGMVLAALSGVLNDNPLQRRFLREPMFRANQLLLQEKVPAALTIDAKTLQPDDTTAAPAREAPAAARVLSRMNTTVPQIQLLSNGRYHVIISQAGGGYSQSGELAVNNWRQDGTRDANGIFCYVQDLDQDLLWSNTWQPTRVEEAECTATFAQAGAEFYCSAHGIYTYTRMAVSSEDDIELRRVTLINRSNTRRRLALTSYAEVVMAPQAAEESHPAFNKLFVETEYVAEHQTILARRRARADDEHPPTFLHLMGVRGAELAKASFETRREAFIGRHGSLAAPAALASRVPLENRAGAVLDSIAALRREVVLEPGAAATVDIVCGVAPTREAALELAARYSDRHLGQRVFDLAWTREQVISHQLNLGQADLPLFARLAGSVLYPDPDMRAQGGGNAASPTIGQSGLWKYGISGDLPIVLVRIASAADLALIRQMLQAHSYWYMHGLRADLVIWNEDASGYRQELHDAIMALVGSRSEVPGLDRPGGVFVRRSEHIGPDDRVLLQACARVTIDARRGGLADQLPRRIAARPKPQRAPLRSKQTYAHELEPPGDLQMFNGTGGFSRDGSEYEIWLPPGQVTPAPWINVLANPDFGSVVSESGGAYTFGQNAHEIRLTPWLNDPVSDESGEAFYIRDEDSGTFWSPTPLPVRGSRAYRVRHGFGYSVFETIQADIASTLTVFVAAQKSLKYSVLKLRNEGSTRRRLSLFACVEWVLGDLRTKCAPHVRTTLDGGGRAIYAGNYFNDAFARSVGVFATDAAPAAASGNRAEFIGRNGNLRDPLALRQPRLSASFGIGSDPCAAFQVDVDLDAGAEREIVFVLGIGADADQARALHDNIDAASAAIELEAVQEAWRERLGKFRVDTPDPATNLLANGWLVYQIVACRLWARSGFYQSGGAYGFRDQLQDVIALLPIEPQLAREQILRCAARQFAEGDVQHWWHPPIGRGVRTHFSDDFLWLPWAVAHYIEATGDAALLDVDVHFLEGRPLRPEEESYYDFVPLGAAHATVYEHCARAIRNGLKVGEHGLPLIGGGDWNDGFNRLGQHGRGESVWLAFFQIDVMRRFAVLARARNDAEFERRCIDESAALARRVDETAWDGAWYRRAYADDGAPIGSAQSDECRIDSLPQSWAALTASGMPQHRQQALDAALSQLVRTNEKLVLLFDPPFDHGSLDPGYIKGYIPGTRENGGQYTHAAVWLGMACAATGRRDAAWQIAQIINPLNHTRTREDAARYRIEPYVIAADVYRAPGYVGRGGWSWYTGSAGWMYRFITESLLGIRVLDGVLHVDAHLPDGWSGYRIEYRYGRTPYTIEIVSGEDGTQGAHEFRMLDDGEAKVLRVVAAPAPPATPAAKS